MKKRILCLFLCLSISLNVFAVVPGVALGNEIASVIWHKVGARGFAANDPRFGALLGAVGAAAVEVGTAAVVAGSAPIWGGVLASAAIAGVVGYGIQALGSWLFNSNGTVTIPASSGSSSGGAQYFVQTYRYDYSRPGWVAYVAVGDMATVARTAAGENSGVIGNDNSYTVVSSSCSSSSCQVRVLVSSAGGVQNNIDVSVYAVSPSQPAPADAVPVASPSTPEATKPVSEALAGMTPEQKAKELAPADVAALADGLWKRAAAQSNYSGPAYISSDPVTPSDVEATRAENPTQAKATAGDLAAPVPATGAVSPAAGTEAAPATTPAVNPAGTTAQVNLGDDPGIGFPKVQANPTAETILSPVFNLLPSFRNFQLPSHTGVCPHPSFTMFDRNLELNAHCSVLESVRPALESIMDFVWLALAFLIILAA